jgi:hypothetical protein
MPAEAVDDQHRQPGRLGQAEIGRDLVGGGTVGARRVGQRGGETAQGLVGKAHVGFRKYFC